MNDDIKQEWIKQSEFTNYQTRQKEVPTIYCLQETCLRFKDTDCK